MASVSTADWKSLAELLRRMMLKRHQAPVDAEDFASEAVRVTLTWLGHSTQPERRIWKYASTTCRRLLASSLRDLRNDVEAHDSLDEVVDARSQAREPDEVTQLAREELCALLLNLKGTARSVLLMLQEGAPTNAEMAAKLDVTVRSIEFAREAIRARGAGILASCFGLDPPSCCRRHRRPHGREAEQGDQRC